ncbi:hypothetical protein Esti_006692 [Eimeria stiedai]
MGCCGARNSRGLVKPLPARPHFHQVSDASLSLGKLSRCCETVSTGKAAGSGRLLLHRCPHLGIVGRRDDVSLELGTCFCLITRFSFEAPAQLEHLDLSLLPLAQPASTVSTGPQAACVSPWLPNRLSSYSVVFVLTQAFSPAMLHARPNAAFAGPPALGSTQQEQAASLTPPLLLITEDTTKAFISRSAAAASAAATAGELLGSSSPAPALASKASAPPELQQQVATAVAIGRPANLGSGHGSGNNIRPHACSLRPQFVKVTF